MEKPIGAASLFPLFSRQNIVIRNTLSRGGTPNSEHDHSLGGTLGLERPFSEPEQPVLRNRCTLPAPRNPPRFDDDDFSEYFSSEQTRFTAVSNKHQFRIDRVRFDEKINRRRFFYRRYCAIVYGADYFFSGRRNGEEREPPGGPRVCAKKR